MYEIKNQPNKTPEGKQRLMLLKLLYILILSGVSCYIVFADVLFVPYVREMLPYGNNRYLGYLFVACNFLIVAAALFPFYWIARMIIARKNQNEFNAQPVQSMDNGNKTKFSFSYRGGDSTVVFDDLSIQFTLGFIKRTFLTERLRNYYVGSTMGYNAFYVTYEGDNGKVKKLRLFEEGGNRQVQLLNAEMQKRFPAKSLNNLSQKEAFKIMGQMSSALTVTIVVLVILLVSAGVIALLVMH